MQDNAPTQHQLLRLHILLGDDEDQLDELFQSFQAADRGGLGSLKSNAEVEAVLRKYLSSKDFKKINVDEIITRFSTDTNYFDYTAFCKTIQKPPVLQPETSQSGRPQSPFERRSRSPTKLRNREQARVHMDKRLESQRLLMESVRHKLIRGMQGDESDGLQGIQNALQRLDITGDGYLDERIFTKKFVQRLKVPLTRPEREFLLEQLRSQSYTAGEKLLNYEQLGRICNLNSDDSLTESDTEPEVTKPPSPTKTSQLGATFLAAEKRLHEFLRAPLASRNIEGTKNSSHETPRCLFTGAEKFLEITELVDQDNTGLLHEDEFTRILSKCGVNIDPDLLNEMLSRFPRSSGKYINYSAFLQRYGQDPHLSRGRRELKQLLLELLARLPVPPVEWHRFLHERFEKYDKKVHGIIKGTLPTEAFLRAIQGRSVVLKLPTEEAAQVTSLFIRTSTSSSPAHLHYNEFLSYIDEGYQISRVKTPQVAVPSSPKATDVDTSEMSVGDYLMYHATAPERRNFETLLETLQSFQTTTPPSSLQPVANGIRVPLGQKLRVSVQFSIA